MSLKLDDKGGANSSSSSSSQSLLPRGCWIALIIAGVFGVLCVIAVVIAIVVIAQNPDVRRVARVVGGSVRLMQESQNGPGARAVRGAGCDRAMVFDVSRLGELAQELDDQPPTGSDAEGTMVICQFVRSGTPPSCDDVARAFHAAAPPQPHGYTVVVQGTVGGNQCSARFAPDGRLLERVGGAAGPNIPIPTQPSLPTPQPVAPPLMPSPFE